MGVVTERLLVLAVDCDRNEDLGLNVVVAMVDGGGETQWKNRKEVNGNFFAAGGEGVGGGEGRGLAVFMASPFGEGEDVCSNLERERERGPDRERYN